MAKKLVVLCALVLLVPLAAAAGTEVPAALPGAPAFPAELRQKLAAELARRGSGYTPRTQHLRPDGSPQYTNRLLFEASPYLQQHAHNPVNWYPWGDEAFAAAKRLGRPVLVSIGYSTCHWCHVMEEESFDDPGVAEVLNAGFIAVKVDREVRPDIDSIYMSAVHAMGQRGGWPLNVWLTPQREPFYGGTYFPPQARGGRPGLVEVLQTIRQQYAQHPERVQAVAAEVASEVAGKLAANRADASRMPGEAVLRRAASGYRSGFDATWGGLRQRIKFPSSFPVRFLLRHARRTGDARALEMATFTLEKMAAGGIYDHVGGGFHRYSTDAQWLVPHFEKMLYDNALLVPAYVEAWQATGREAFADVARDVLDYVAREMTAPGGGFYSATDADSVRPDGESEEGWFFTWTRAELDAVLGPAAAPVAAWFGVTRAGNFEGRNVLHVPRGLEAAAAALKLSPGALRATLDASREKLRAARARRPAPLRDDKILVAWNGLMISAFAQAGFAFAEPAYVRAAERAATFLLENLRSKGRLQRVYLDGKATGPAFLEDHAFLIAGLLDLYEAAPDPRWLREGIALQRVLDTHYADFEGGAYYRTADDHEALLVREKPADDGAVPSGNSVSALNLLRLAAFTEDPDPLERASLLFSAYHDALVEQPAQLSEMLLALDFAHDVPKEIILVGPTQGGAAGPLLDRMRKSFVPNRILAVVREGEELAAHAALVPLVKGKVARGGIVTAYVCQNRVCGYPTSDPDEFAKQLRATQAPGVQ